MVNTESNNPTIQIVLPLNQVSHPYPTTINQSLAIKIDRNNYLLWKNQILNVVIANGLDGSSIPTTKLILYKLATHKSSYYELVVLISY